MKKSKFILHSFSLKKSVIRLIKFYQNNISVKTSPKCRFVPTCSSYAIIAIERFGLFRGSIMSIFRILRCNPFCKCGYDPVPEKKKRKK